MTERMKRLLKVGKKDDEFIRIFQLADPTNELPGLFADHIHKVVFISIYYGYLLAKHGTEWESHIWN